MEEKANSAPDERNQILKHYEDTLKHAREMVAQLTKELSNIEQKLQEYKEIAVSTRAAIARTKNASRIAELAANGPSGHLTRDCELIHHRVMAVMADHPDRAVNGQFVHDYLRVRKYPVKLQSLSSTVSTLQRSGLIERVGLGTFRITQKGLQRLAACEGSVVALCYYYRHINMNGETQASRDGKTPPLVDEPATAHQNAVWPPL